MKPLFTTLIALLSFMGSELGEGASWADAASRAGADHDSHLQPHCDFCWEPSPYEQSPNRLPTYKPHRPRRPPGSRPSRIPKGGYTLVPNKKKVPSSLRRSRARHHPKPVIAQRIVVVDGDTIRIGSERIRLRGIDTPELSEPDGWAAKQRLEELLNSGSVAIVKHGRDVYDRLIADVFMDGQNVAEILEREGFAKSK
ncbi:MAG: thermonuclease family protein [Nitrospira sp.]|nr:thermonuclease family protein [Nitrospira sp.]